MSQPRRAKPESVSQLNRFDCVAISLFLLRYFLPTEAVEQGHTLWIAALWFLFWAIGSWLRWRETNQTSQTWTTFDIAVGCLIVGHLLSGSMVLLGSEDKRAALNLMWEWAALGVMYFHLKRMLQTAAGRQTVLSGLLITGLALSALGLWQHFVWYRLQSEEVTELLELHDRQTSSRLSNEETQRYQKLSNEYGADILTLDNTGRKMFLARVGASVEPIGRFALANTLGGLLACLGALLIASLIERYRTTSRLQFVLSLSGVGLLVTCLLLTKSRTGMLGLLVGLGLFLFKKLLEQSHSRMMLKRAGISLGLLSVLIGTLFITKSLDLEVLSEAPKSLQYRMEYWTATFNMLTHSPVLGVGPGNFRQHYMQYKLPGSSEEILDPHNLFLDVWANGGMLALIGLIAITTYHLWIRIFLNKYEEPTGNTEEQNTEKENPVSLRSLVFIGSLTGGIILGYEYLILGIADTIMFWTWLSWLLIAVIYASNRISLSTTPTILIFPFIALGVNLLAAGGIGMPAITQLFLIIALLSRSNFSPPWFISVPTWLSLVSSVIMLVTMLWTALVPHLLVTNLLETGQSEMIVHHQTQRAINTFTEATEVDTLHPESWQQLASALFTRWTETGKRDEQLFEQAIYAQRQSIQRDFFSPNRYRMLGEFWWVKSQSSSDPEAIHQSSIAYEAASYLYPNSAPILAQLAIAQSANTEDKNTQLHSQITATRALELNNLNSERGHSDKLLSAEIIEQLEAIQARKTPSIPHK